jgi:hypothetical protein
MADYSRQRDGGLQSRAKSQENVRKSEMADYSRERNGGLQSRAKWRITVDSEMADYSRERNVRD